MQGKKELQTAALRKDREPGMDRFSGDGAGVGLAEGTEVLVTGEAGLTDPVGLSGAEWVRAPCDLKAPVVVVGNPVSSRGRGSEPSSPSCRERSECRGRS